LLKERSTIVISHVFQTRRSVQYARNTSILPADTYAELNSAILSYLIAKGFTRSCKAFEKEATTKPGDANKLEEAWTAFSAQ
jgi:hypothetical protein